MLGHHQDKVVQGAVREVTGMLVLPSGHRDKRGERGTPHDSRGSALCEMAAAGPGGGLSCPRGHVPGVPGTEPALVPNAAASTQRCGRRPPATSHAAPPREPAARDGPPRRVPPVPAVHRACGREPTARGSGSAAPASTRDNRVATVQSVVRQTATCRGTPAQSDRPTAHPDAGVSEAPA